MICPKCGTNNPDDSVFCEKCGTSLAAQQTIPATPTAPPAPTPPAPTAPPAPQQPSHQQTSGDTPAKTKTIIAILCAAALVLWLLLRLLGLM